MFRAAFIAVALLLLVRCVAGTDVGKREYACVSDADCVEGFVCRTVCVPSSTATAGGNGTAGGSATAGGSTTAGGAEAGGGAAGGMTAGGTTAGGNTAGGSTAGGATAGGATAGGATAGGATAGGATAGGATAGGATAGGATAGGATAGGATAGGAANGTPCTTGTQCASAQCVDGYCCSNACGSPCNACNVPGFLGQCRVLPLGATPSPACPGSYACNGVGEACATACTSDAGCVAARCAGDGVCIPKLHTFKESFSASFDPAVWSVGHPNCQVVGGRYHVSSVGGSSAYPAIATQRRYDFTDSWVSAELVDAGDQTQPTFEAYLASVCDYASSNRCLALLANEGEMFIELKDGNNYSSIAGTVPIAAWRFYRMREQGGTLYFEGSLDGGSYTQLGSVPTPFIGDFRDVYLWSGAGAYGPEPTGTTAVYDNINLP